MHTSCYGVLDLLCVKSLETRSQPVFFNLDFLCINSVESGSLEKFFAQHGISAQIVLNDLNREEEEDITTLRKNVLQRQSINDAISFDKYNR